MKNRLEKRELVKIKKEGRKAYFFWQFFGKEVKNNGRKNDI